MDRITGITINRTDEGLFRVNVKGFSQGQGYHDKPRKFSGQLFDEFEGPVARAMAKTINRPLMESFWNEKPWKGERLTIERLKQLLFTSDN